MMTATLEIEGVYTAYDKADVLQGVSLKVEPGRITCLLGSNGSGKTTLVRSILGLTPPRAGRIVFDGADITRLPTHKIIAAGIACIPEGRKVFPKLTVEENLRVGAYQERSDKVRSERLADILRIFPRLSERRTQLAGTMSGGEQAMVSIGRGLMCAPKLLSDRRAVARPFAAAGEGKFQHHSQHQRARHHRASCRAERAPDACDFPLRLCAVERPRGRERHTGRTCSARGCTGCLLWITMTSSVELTQDLVRFRTINPPGDERACAERLASLLETAGFAVDLVPFGEGRAQLVARIGGASGKPAIGFTGHLDTVPLGAQLWTVDPLAADINDGRLYGRGSSDMKSGVAAFVTACNELAADWRDTPGVVLYITAGEETGCTGAAALAHAETPLPQCWCAGCGGADGQPVLVGHKGALWLEAVTTGVTAHGSMPEKGVNAVYKAARAATAPAGFRLQFCPA